MISYFCVFIQIAFMFQEWMACISRTENKQLNKIYALMLEMSLFVRLYKDMNEWTNMYIYIYIYECKKTEYKSYCTFVRTY